MKAGHKRIMAVAAAAAVMAVVAVTVVVVRREPTAGHQSAGEVADIARRLPEGLTPLDPAHPNPTGDDPAAVGMPPKIPRSLSEDDILSRQAQRRAAGVASGPAAPAKPAPGRAAAPHPPADDDSLLVSYGDGTSGDAVVAALARAGVHATAVPGIHVVEVDAGDEDLARLTTRLKGVDGVTKVEPNFIRSIEKVPNDPGFAAQSAAFTTAHVPGAWDVAVTGSATTVAVLDTGVDLDHPDLAPNLVAGHNELNPAATPADDNGHGTEVAGLIGAVTNNGSAMAGVAWNARIMPVKVLAADGTGDDGDIVSGIVWATDQGAKVINMSLGGYLQSDALDQAIGYALDHEVVVVAAAGNDSTTAPSYPGASPGVIGVTATDASGHFAWFSNHGPWYFLSAPGVNVPTTALAAGPTPATTTATGTSFSSPIVAGVAALVRERHPGWGWVEVLSDVVRTGRDAGPAGLDNAYQFGIVDAAAALGVSPLGPTHQPNLAGDAGNVPAAARAITPGTPASETLGYEYDDDWFGFDVAAPSGATVTVTPPAALAFPAVRAAEFDPVIELYGPGGGLVAQADAGVIGEPETVTVDLAAGHHTLWVRNFAGSAGPGPYTVSVTLGAMAAPRVFGPAKSIAGVPWQEATAVADFNGDGRDDVALSAGLNCSGGQDDCAIYVYTQGTDGTLGPPRKLATHASYPAMGDPLRAADLDGDGDVDLARGTPSGLDVAWNSQGSLTDPVLYTAPGRVRQLQVADVDGDGTDDLVAGAGYDDFVTGAGGDLSVLTWTGAGFHVAPTGFASETTSFTGIGYDVADLTGDGRVDIAALEGDHVGVHAQRADGTWAAAAAVAVPGFGGCADLCSIAVGDVTDDNRADIVASSQRGGLSDVIVGVQQAGGGFVARPPLTVHGTPASIRIADVTGDGRGDVSILVNGGTVSLLRQTSTGTLSPEEELGGVSTSWERSPDSLTIGDVDGDGLDEPVAVTPDCCLFAVPHQAGAAAAEGAGPWVQNTSPAPHATGVARSVHPVITFGRDVNASSVGPIGGSEAETVALLDGRDGALVPITTSVSGRRLTITPTTPLTAGAPYQIILAGITSPQALDDFADEIIPFTVAPGPKPSFSVATTYIPVVLDLDDNGYDDILWYGPGSAPDTLWLFTPDGHESFAESLGGTFTPIVGDFDGNGYQDIFWYGPGSGADVMWANSRDGIVARSLPVRGVYKPIAGDFDRNGFDDIFWYGPGTAADSLWKFNATGHTSVTQSVSGTSYRPAAGDFTRDGFDDIVWYAPGSAAESLWRGGTTPFTHARSLSITGTYNARTMDFNADGFDELFLSTTNRSVFVRSGTGGFTGTQAGPPVPAGMRPAIGDFTGDIREDLLAYVPGTAADTFYLGTAAGVS